MKRSEMRTCGKPFTSAEEAARSKAVLNRLAEVRTDLPCGHVHIRPLKADRFTSFKTGGSPLGAGQDTGPDEKTRKAVYARDSYQCVCCGTLIDKRPHSVGHRMRRSQGGSNKMSNLLTFLGLGSNPLDPDDHHARIDSRKKAADEAQGYTCRSWQDPAEVTVMIMSAYGSGMSVFLADDGTYRDENGTVIQRAEVAA